ncbi:hypothetical protein PPACK8108_LOCUS26153 [Phakopsora pachyrhizi]|uniref:Glutathione synthase substrate-binding domain-containing protein n=1 Tax=Phakopsora pachyrhizi TaxID=170000 RepID=A0AAV0BVC7_PHAPC|nr:hypothetical protein PPACK8108_LOCUS26153 [Phakopsora pachyrhizi]
MPTVILMIVQPGERKVFLSDIIDLPAGKDEHGTHFEVSVVYYCSMYGPEDFMPEDCWQTRVPDESSESYKKGVTWLPNML